MTKSKFQFKLVLSVFAISLTTIVEAQKLPAVQTKSLMAPATVKVDGKAVEYNDQFQAFNKKAGVYYTMANDKDKLYLTVQAVNPSIITKLIAGGITLTINNPGKKDEKSVAKVSFPAYRDSDEPLYITLDNLNELRKSKEKNAKQIDSVMREVNLKLADNIKFIGVSGLKASSDSIVSVYNTDGIKAMSLMDSNLRYTWELAVPLKQLGVSSERTSAFSYNIRLNGSANNAVITLIPRRNALTFKGKNGINYSLPATPEGLEIAYPADFDGEYQLWK